MNAEGTISRAEAAELLGVHPRTLDRWVRDGHVPYVEVGPSKIRRYRQAAIEKLMQPVDAENEEG